METEISGATLDSPDELTLTNERSRIPLEAWSAKRGDTTFLVASVEDEKKEMENSGYSHSMDVGPPPTTTKDSRRVRSSSDTKGLAALSKHSRRRLRMLRASPSCFRKNTWFFWT